MGDNRSFAALEWVIDEIGDTLREARQALEAYVEDPRDTARIRFCLTHIHQVHGTLQMVEFHGASLFAEEMEAVAKALLNDEVTHIKEAQEVLMRSLLQLPLYLDQVKARHEDNPAIALPLLNDLRAVRKQSYLSETNLFTPDLSSLNHISGTRHAILSDGPKLKAALNKLLEMLHYAAAGVLRGVRIDENLNFVDKVVCRLEAMTRGTARHNVWLISSALTEALLRDDVELSVAVRGLLRHLVRELRILLEHGQAALAAPPKEALIRNLLYYVARANDGGDRVAKVKQRFKLDGAIIGGREGLQSTPDAEAIKAVVLALQDELNTAKHLLDLGLSGHGGLSDIEEMLPVVKRISDTLAILGIGDMRNQTLEQYQMLVDMCSAGAVSDSVLIDVAGRLADLEHRLEAIAKGAGRTTDYASLDERTVEIDSAKDAVLEQCRAGFDEVKEAIVDAMSSQWSPENLPAAVDTLHNLHGGLNIVPLPRPAALVECCRKYIKEQLVGRETSPGAELQVLAEAIASIDYYIERLAGGHADDIESYLDIAEESVAQLGYPLTGFSDNGAEVSEPRDERAEELPVKTPDVEPELPKSIAEPESDIATESAQADESAEADDLPAPDDSLAALLEPVSEYSEQAPEIAETTKPAAEFSASEAIAMADEDEEPIDEEIIEIFVEEAAEVLETLNDAFPKWQETLQDDDTLTVVRRSFHTLKGSGRMVEAMDVGELAWAIENMLNRVMDKTVEPQNAHVNVVSRAIDLVPQLVEAFKNRTANPNPEEMKRLIDWANRLAAGDVPPEVDASGAYKDLEPVSNKEPVPQKEAATPKSDKEAPEPEEENEDLVLWEIFASEAVTHLEVVDEFIQEMQEAAPLYTMPSDPLQRALHTLKGSAHMACVTDIATMATPLEGFMKELRSYQIKIDHDILELLIDGATYTREGIASIGDGKEVSLQNLDQYVARVQAQYAKHIEPLIHKDEHKVDTQKADPSKLSAFMTEDMNLLLDAHKLLQAWQNEGQAADVPGLMDELKTLRTSASEAHLGHMVQLSDQLLVIYEAAAANQLEKDAEFFAVLGDAHDRLLDMFDAIAASQNLPVVGEGLQSRLDELLKFVQQREGDNLLVETRGLDGLYEDDLLVIPEEEAVSEPENLEDADAEEVEPEEYQEPVTLDGEWQLEEDEHKDEAPQFASGDVGMQESVEDSEQETVEETAEEALEEIQEEIQEKTGIETDSSTDEQTSTPEPEFQTPEPAEPAAVSATQDQNSASYINEEDFDPDILEIFLEEADELLEELDESIHEWESDWDNREPSEVMKRVLHTLKGGARLSGLKNLGDLTHNYESFLIATRDPHSDDNFFERINRYQDALLTAVRGVRARLNGEPVPEEAAPPPEVTLPEGEPESTPPDEVSAQSHAAMDLGGQVLNFPGALTSTSTAIAASTATDSGAVQSQSKRQGSQETVKVSADLLEELVNLAGETSISRGRLEQQVSDLGSAVDEVDATLRRLNEQLRRLDIETEAQVLFRQEQMAAHDEDFDPLEMDRYSQLQQLTRSLMESASDLYDLKYTLSDKLRDTETLLLQQSRINTSLQEGLMRSRMVPFSRLVPRLRRIVRQVAGELGKHVNFELDNVEGEMDRSVLERMVAPLEHMLRNAVDHGVESPSDRTQKGKPETGRIVLGMAREGGDILLRLADDGRGINLERVREKAIERGLMTEDSTLSDHEIMQFILQAGFSTAENVTQISGRGVGMDVVAAEIKQLGGSMVIDSKAGVGTQFTVRLPFTVSVNRALMVALEKETFAVPLSSIEGIVRVSPFELEHYYNHPDARFEYAGENYQVRHLGSMLDPAFRPKLDGHTLPLPVILVRSAKHTMALQVDGLSGSREIVVKSLGPQFAAVQGVSGATVMGDGSVVVILDPLALVRRELALIGAELQPLISTQAPEAPPEDEHKTIMVVDDSVTVRKVTTRFLEREGFNVITAKDGVDAIQVLQEHMPDLMLLDIEMPRMDGFEVARTVRSTSRLKHLPIIMITSRTGDKHRQHALSIGVNEYLGKPYQEESLLRHIETLLEAQMSA